MTQLFNLDTSIHSPEIMMQVPEPAAPPFPTVHHASESSEHETQSTEATLEEPDSATASPEKAHTDSNSSSSSPEKEKEDNKSVPPPRSSIVSFFPGASDCHFSGQVTIVEAKGSVTVNVAHNDGGGSSPTRFGSSFRSNRPFGPNNNPFPKPGKAFGGLGASNTTAGNSTSSSPSSSPSTPDNDNRFATFGGDKFGNNASNFTITNGCFTNSNGELVVNGMRVSRNTSRK